jgi:hypothetical protein
MDPETFFPAPLEAADTAVALCGRCPVSGACLAWALRVGDCHGVWGGTTARERRAMLVAWRTEVQPDEAPYSPRDAEEELVVAAGDLAPVMASNPEVRVRIPAQRRADIALQNLGEAPDALDDTLLLTREPVRTA